MGRRGFRLVCTYLSSRMLGVVADQILLWLALPIYQISLHFGKHDPSNHTRKGNLQGLIAASLKNLLVPPVWRRPQHAELLQPASPQHPSAPEHVFYFPSIPFFGLRRLPTEETVINDISFLAAHACLKRWKAESRKACMQHCADYMPYLTSLYEGVDLTPRARHFTFSTK
ncbi:hypothetical protein GGS20DRAFT_435351 [Poronia punctata]|nr:hypothetical protein GGS20DRAFT_435351 [Poronia punctata]